MLAPRPNSRQIPRLESYTASKNYHDLLYGYLQLVSLPSEDGYSRYVKAEDINFTKIGKVIGLTRQTTAKKFGLLQELGLVGKESNDRFDLNLLENEYATLVPLDVLEVIVHSKVVHSLSLYVYMLSRFGAEREKPFNYVLATVKKHIGISSNTYANSNIVTNAMDELQRLRLIEYWQGNTESPEGKKVCVQVVMSVKNIIDTQ